MTSRDNFARDDSEVKFVSTRPKVVKNVFTSNIPPETLGKMKKGAKDDHPEEKPKAD
jgi:hypothetical protein